MRPIRALLAALTAGLLAICLMAPGCAGGDSGTRPHVGGNGGGAADSGVGGSGGTTGAGVCLLNNCHSDSECEGCSFKRTKCKVDENRCVACYADKDCKTGEQCSSFGVCAPKDLQCPTDNTGTPTISCTKQEDCLACDPLHQVCDTSQSKCVACSSGNTQSCTGNQSCGATGKCEEKCPANCTSDADCGKCANGSTEAKICANHVCSECSATSGCPLPGTQCEKGKCIKPCGTVGGAGADCMQDADCYGCGNSSSNTSWKCKFPINGGTHGTCTVPASGCTDLVSAGGAVLPPPFDQVTNLCSDDSNCANVSIDFNVGKLIRDLIGGSDLNLGLKVIKIQDAVIKYPMPTCASVELFDGNSCGVCVPCNDDADCKPISLDPLVSDLFKGDPLMQLAASFLMDLLFGKGNEHALHMQCQDVAAGYGVCVPCANPLSACGAGSGTVGGGSCSHDTCSTGGPLDPSCGLCESEVCALDLFCCSKEWDELCVKSVDAFCGAPCPGDPSCEAHNPCQEGAAMNVDCSMCTQEVCAKQSSCCDTTSGQWDSTCTNLVLNDATIKPLCNGACPGTSSCSHSECDPGAGLTTSCSECASIICAADSWCCSKEWDAICVGEAGNQPKCPACPQN